MARRQDWEGTRHTLIQRLKNREDQESWGTFVDIYRRRLFGMGLSAGLNEAEAEDAAQETIIGVFKDIEKYDPSLGPFTSWLLQRLKWRITDELRKRKHQDPRIRAPRTSTRTGTLERIPDEAPLEKDKNSEQEWKDYLLRLAVENIKAQVKAADFQIFQFVALKRMPVETVAAQFGKTPNAIFIIKHRVQKVLEKEIEKVKEIAP